MLVVTMLPGLPALDRVTYHLATDLSPPLEPPLDDPPDDDGPDEHGRPGDHPERQQALPVRANQLPELHETDNTARLQAQMGVASLGWCLMVIERSTDVVIVPAEVGLTVRDAIDSPASLRHCQGRMGSYLRGRGWRTRTTPPVCRLLSA